MFRSPLRQRGAFDGDETWTHIHERPSPLTARNELPFSLVSK